MLAQRVIITADEAKANIYRYNAELVKQPRLVARIKQHPAWYAARDENGAWQFGPSKFIGYQGANARDYLASYSRKDGRDTEPALKQWFQQVDPESALGRELRGAFIAFAQSYGKTPNANWRVSVLQSLVPGSAARQAGESGGNRIVFDAGICGGRARIAGTRVRVSDIVAMVADGAERKEILEDFPYLTDEDISAALSYAAKSVDHVILRAA